MSVRTVLGDVASEALGRTLMHEHLILDSDLIRDTMPHIHLPSVESAIAEVTLCREAGIGAMVDAMPAAGGRNPRKLEQIARRAGVHIVAATGLHTEKYYPDHDWATNINPERLAKMFVDDIEIGIDAYDHAGDSIERTGVRAGLIKVASGTNGMDERAIRLFEAASNAAHRTGVPILTHTEAGLGAMDQVEALIRLGIPPDRVVISHTDKASDIGYHTDLLSTGVSVEYDQALRRIGQEPNSTAVLVATMVEHGFTDQLMVGTDGARRSLWTSLGGSPGLAYMGIEFVDVLAAHGVDAETTDVIFAANPQRFLNRAVAPE